jgi:hypothetical protein
VWVRFGTCLGPSPLKHNVAIRLTWHGCFPVRIHTAFIGC